jgi:ABC-2 type transport system permease protein
LLDSGDAVFFVLFSAVFLILTVKRLHNNRVYG